MTLWAAVLLVAAVATHEDDIYAPIFHVSPAGCGGGWLNDPNAPFEFKGRHHLFYQYARDDAPGPGPGGRLISWGHVAGNLSHARCLPPALVPGVDGDGSPTPYDAQGVFTGSVTVVGGRPVATYPAMPGSHMAGAWPADVDDPDLATWAKDPRNPLDGDVRGGPLAGPLGCTAAWREGGTWTTTIEGGRPLAVKFFASADFVAWDEEGDLDCPACAACAVPCSDFYPFEDRWIFGINSFGCHLASGGAVVGELGENRTFTVAGARAREVAAELAAGSTANASYFAYDYGAAKYPKGYETSDGRRIQYAWLDEPADTPKNQTWLGAQTAPRVVARARADDPSTSVLVNPVAELAALRTAALAADASAAGAGAWAAAGVAGRHLDVVVDFRGWAAGPVGVAAQNGTFAYTFTPLGAAGGLVRGRVEGTGGAGFLSIPATQELLRVRVLVDGSVGEAFFDGGRARVASRAYGAGDAVALLAPANATASLSAWAMGSMWLP